MIAGIFHQGSGLGNQLHRYIASRVLARDKGFVHGMLRPELFKGASFMEIDMGQPFSEFKGNATDPVWNEKKVVENGVDIRSYDPEIHFVKDGTIIDGEFQDPRYFEHQIHNIRDWLKVKPMELPDDLCVIGFRGGEFTIFPDLFLPPEYWQKAIGMMKSINPNMRFEVHTDDPITAKAFFPDYHVIHNVEINWRSVRYAKYLIIANSSFYIFPSLLNQNVDKIIAPRYWARHNTKTWALPQNYYKEFTYI